jgi:hypothetical protein
MLSDPDTAQFLLSSSRVGTDAPLGSQSRPSTLSEDNGELLAGFRMDSSALIETRTTALAGSRTLEAARKLFRPPTDDDAGGGDDDEALPEPDDDVTAALPEDTTNPGPGTDTDAPPSSQPRQPPAYITRLKGAINDYTDGHFAFMNSFVHLFITGAVPFIGIPPLPFLTHLLYLCDRRFAQCMKFVFCAFDTHRRRKICAVVAASVNADPVVVREMNELVSEPDFDSRLDASVRDSTTSDARALNAKLQSMLKLGLEDVEYTQGARSGKLIQMKAQQFYCGQNLLFVTIAPYPEGSALMLKIALGKPDSPLATDAEALAAFKIPDKRARSDLASLDPAATVIHFKRLMHVVYHHLLKILPSGMLHAPKPFSSAEREAGLWGKPVCASSVDEEQVCFLSLTGLYVLSVVIVAANDGIKSSPSTG